MASQVPIAKSDGDTAATPDEESADASSFYLPATPTPAVLEWLESCWAAVFRRRGHIRGDRRRKSGK